MTQESIDKILKKYWDYRFNNVRVEARSSDEHSFDWFGIYRIDNIFLVSTPMRYKNGKISIDKVWYTHEPTFGNDWEIVNISQLEFNESMRKYVNNRFNQTIEKIL